MLSVVVYYGVVVAIGGGLDRHRHKVFSSLGSVRCVQATWPGHRYPWRSVPPISIFTSMFVISCYLDFE